MDAKDKKAHEAAFRIAGTLDGLTMARATYVLDLAGRIVRGGSRFDANGPEFIEALKEFEAASAE